MTKALFIEGLAWTDERITLLSKLWADGLSCSQIAAQLGGITRNSVIGKITRLGLGKRMGALRRPGGVMALTRTVDLAARSARQVAAPRPVNLELAAPRVAPRPSSEPLTPTCQLTDLTSHMCRWPIGDPALSSFGFCGRLAEGNYCAAHRKRACQAAEQKTDKELMRSVRRFL